MPARTPGAAVEAFLERVRRTTACVAVQPVQVTASQPSESLGAVSFVPLNKPVPLLGKNRTRLLLSIRCDYVIRAVDVGRDPFEVSIVGYAYQILDADQREILAFHWHPRGVSPITLPHVHLTSRVRPFDLPRGGTIALAEMHIPTGFVTIADIARLLITEFEVEPRRHNWAEILETEWPEIPGSG